MRNQFNHGLKRRERFPTPIDGNVRKESVLDLVPFAGGWRQVANGDGQTGLSGQGLQLLLPQPIARPIRTPTIRHAEQFPTAGLQFPAHSLPPPPDSLHRKLSGLMLDATVNNSTSR